jgi:two-component system cell cycle sensor histidine kinase/response regulator CckA
LGLLERLKEGVTPLCCSRALETGRVTAVENPSALCPDCPVAAAPGEHGVMASLLRHRERVYGALLVSVATDHVGDEEEHALLAEVTGDLAFALHGLELQKEQAKAGETLRSEQERAQMYLDVAGVIFVALDAHGNVILMNKKGCAVLGWEEGEILGSNWFDTFLPKGMRAGVKGVFGGLMGGEIDPVEYYENPVVTKSGEERIIAWHNTLLRDAEGGITGTLSSGEDITERRRLEAHLQEAQKMEAIGTLAGGIAHDFNNLLSVVQGNVSLMLFDIDPAHPHFENLKTIEKQIRSGAELTRQLLGYARKGRYYVKAISLNEVVRETSTAFGKTRKDIVIQTDLEDGPCPIEVDRGQIEQVVLNLYVNAADAMPAGGTLTLQTAHVTHEEIQSKVYEPKPGEYVLLRVSDTGSGMNEETRRRLFEPFFTTKAMGRGTGLGLASTYGIVKGHGGYIDVESQEGKGSTFRIFFPATKKEIEHTVYFSGDLVTGSGTILLVDDEELVLATAAKVLKRLGYTVIEARSGQEVVEVYRGNKDRVDMVVLDMIMPEMGGGEVFDKIKEINPDVKVLLSSGYSIDSQAKEILARGCRGFIQKPFSVKEFSSAVKAVFDS